MESLVLSFIGFLIGTVLGYLAAYFFIQFFTQAVSEEFLILTLTIRPISYFNITSVLLTTIFVSQVPAIRYVSKLNLAHTVKEAAL